MKTLYFDCKNGISGDMLLRALMELSGCAEQVEQTMAAEVFSSTKDEQGGHHDDQGQSRADHHHHHDHPHHDHHPHHGRSYQEVRKLIEHSSFSAKAKETALNIYSHIAEAEANVHGETLQTIYFHEVGRDEAIKNALGIGMALEAIGPDRICTTDIYDGKGTVVCSHGEIPVPVPAVQALMQKCSYVFRTADDVHTEMVTPSGLAGLMGIGAVPMQEQHSGSMDQGDHGRISERVAAEVEIRGTRDTGRGGLKAYLAEISAETPTEISAGKSAEEDMA